MIDDGSYDEIRDYLYNSSLPSNFHVYFCTHKGVSATRNYGILQAKGKYISFIDADDMIHMDFFAHAFSIAEKYKFPDLIIGGLEYVPFGTCNQTQFGDSVDYFEGDALDYLKLMLIHIKCHNYSYSILGTPCGRLYKTEIARKCLFPTGVALCEDQIYNRYFLICAKNAVVVPEMWYKYIQNSDSVMHTKVKSNYFEMIKPYWDELYRLDALEPIKMKRYLRDYYIGLLFSLAARYTETEYKTFKDIMSEAIKQPLMNLALETPSLISTLPNDRKIEFIALKLKNYRIIWLLTKMLTFINK